MTSALARSDFVRAPMLAAADPRGYKEWHHVVVDGRAAHILLNFSLNTEIVGGITQLAPRVIVIAHDRRWTGAIERFGTEDLSVSPDFGGLTIGDSRMRVTPDGYRVQIDLPRPGIRGEIAFTPVSRPFVVNNQPVGAGRMSWLFVPRLRADGWLRVGGAEHRLERELAYHDHNWGRFWWGDDFGWTWGTILPTERTDPWSLVYLQMTDRNRLRFQSQAVYLWHRDEPAAMLLRSAVTTHTHGTLIRDADCTLPPAMRLVVDGQVPGVPERVEIAARRGADAVHAEFRAASYARLVHPSEMHLDRSTVLCETSGTAHVTGTIAGQRLDFTGAGVFEFLHG